MNATITISAKLFDGDCRERLDEIEDAITALDKERVDYEGVAKHNLNKDPWPYIRNLGGMRNLRHGVLALCYMAQTAHHLNGTITIGEREHRMIYEAHLVKCIKDGLIDVKEWQ